MCTEEKQDNIHEAKHYIPPTVNQASLMMMVHYISFEQIQIAGKFLFSLKKKIVGTSGNSCYRSKYSIVVVNDAPRVNVSFLKVWKN